MKADDKDKCDERGECIICIPFYNYGDKINVNLSTLSNLEDNFKIFILDSSVDSQLVYRGGYDRVKCIKVSSEYFNHGATRNIVLEYYPDAFCYVFMSQDIILNEDSIRELVLGLTNSNSDAVYGRQISDHRSSIIDYIDRTINYPSQDRLVEYDDIEKIGVKAFFLSNAFSAYLGSTFRELEGFNEKLIMNEDMHIAKRILDYGGRISYISKATVIHIHNYSNIQLFKRFFDHGVFMFDHSDMFKNIKSGYKMKDTILKSIQICFNLKKPLSIIKVFTAYAFKYMGLRVGMKYSAVPSRIRPLISMHSQYWKNKR